MAEIVTREDFEQWRVDPVTKWVFAGIRRAMAQERAEWMRVSFDAAPPDGKTSPAVLIELRTRHDALGDLIDNDFGNWSEWNADAR